MLPVNKTKVVYLITGLNTGGAEVLLEQFLGLLDRNYFEPVVLSFIPIGEIGRNIERMGVGCYSLNIRKTLNDKNQESKLALFLRSMAVVFIEFPKLVKFIKKEKPDIVHAHLFHANLLGRLAGKICGVPIIISTIHNVNFGGGLRERLLRYTDNLGTVTVAISKNVATAMIDKGVVPSHRLRVIENGVNPDKFSNTNDVTNTIRKQLGASAKQHLLVSVGRLTEQKGYPYLFKALEYLQEHRDDLLSVILGDGEESRTLENIVKQSGLNKSVVFLGNKSNVADYLMASDIFVMPSLWEGLPISLLEAMACGLPVVATNVGGVPEVVADNESGFLVPAKDSEALADKISVLLSMSDTERREFGAHGRKIILNKFSLKNTVQSYVDLYREFTPTFS